MKKLLITLVLCFSIFNGFAQDLIYTVSGEIEGNKTSLDSILVENLTNDTRILFDNLPVLDYYQINLTQNAFWGTVGISNLEKNPVFDVIENRPGSLTIAYRENSSTDVMLAVYNINGQKIFNSERGVLNGGNSIKVKLGSAGMFLVKIESSFGTSTFKAIGDNSFSGNDMEVSELNTKAAIKSANENNDADISFVPGDSIQILVYKDGYFADALKLVIDTSKFVNFLFEEKTTGVVGSFTDVRDGKTYGTITINGKEWMTEDMAYLPSVSKVASESQTEPFYYVYGYSDTIVNDAKATDNFKEYGVLYNLPGAEDACPGGWHIPTDEEWEQMAQFISIQNGGYDKAGNVWQNIGKHLKAKGTVEDGDGLWVKNGVEDIGIDDYGFTGLPGGYRNGAGYFDYLGEYGCWWTSTELSSSLAYYRYLSFNNITFTRGYYPKEFGFSVRYVKD